MTTYKYEVHGTRDAKPFYSTFVAVDNPELDPTKPALIVKAANQEVKAWDFFSVEDRATEIYNSIGVTDVKIAVSRF